MIRDLFWTPFDSRFSKLLDRLRDHQELFDSEMMLDSQKAVERKLDRTLNNLRKQESNAAAKQLESEKNIAEAVKERLERTISTHFSKLEERIRSTKEQQENESARIAAEETNALSKCHSIPELGWSITPLNIAQGIKWTKSDAG